jgi:hypothetical protein
MNKNQIIRAAVFGAIVWFCAAMTVHFGAPLFDSGWANALIFAAIIPGCWALMPMTRMAAAIGRAHILDAAVVGLIAATFLDGIAMTWFSGLYAGTSLATQNGAAFILWGIGWILLFAWRDRAKA